MKTEEEIAVLEVMPKAFIYTVLGGFKESLTHKELLEKAEAIEYALCIYMSEHNQIIDLASTGKGLRLVFAKQPQGERTDDL